MTHQTIFAVIALFLVVALGILVWGGLSKPCWKFCPKCRSYHSEMNITRITSSHTLIADEELCASCKEVQAECDCEKNNL